MVLKHFSFCKSSQIGNAQIPEESLGERRMGCSCGEVVQPGWGWGQSALAMAGH